MIKLLAVLAALLGAIAATAVPASANVPPSYNRTFSRTIEGVYAEVQVIGYSDGRATTLTRSGPGGARRTRQIGYRSDGSSQATGWIVGDTYWTWTTAYRFATRHQVCFLTPNGRYRWTIYVGGSSSLPPSDYGVGFTAGATSC